MIREKNRPAPGRPKPPPLRSGRNPRWVSAAISRELENIRNASEGNANNTLNAVAYRLGRIAGNPHSGLVESDVKADIVLAASHLTARDGLKATLRTVESGWNAGIKKPVPIPEASNARR